VPSIVKQPLRKRALLPPLRVARKGVATPKPPAGDGTSKVSSVDQIVAEILRGLYEGRYVAGQKLTESDLTRRFGVGRGTVREGLRRLAAEGVVTVSLHRGASIRALTRDDVRDILEMLEALLGVSARLAAERIQRAADKKALSDMVPMLAMFAERSDTFAVARQRDRFYAEIARICANRELTRAISMAQVHLIRVQFRDAYGLDSGKRRQGDYERIAEAIATQDASGAERAMRQHIRHIARAIQQLPDHHFAF
jgi:DNA-binding GntR family transcriptional regulator